MDMVFLILLSIIVSLVSFYVIEQYLIPKKKKTRGGGGGKKLVILDLYGLLVHRHSTREPVGDWNKLVSPATLLGTNLTWDRPHRDDFLTFLFDNFTVAIWSSAMYKNVDLLAAHIFGPERRKQLLFEFDQSYCETVTPHPDPKENKPLFKKNLTTVWAAFPQYNQDNTLLIDDSNWKTIGNPAGTVIKVQTWHPIMYDDALSENGYIRNKLKFKK